MGVIVSFPLTRGQLPPCGHLDNTESNETPGNTIHVIRELLNFALLHYASENFLNFALNTLLHFATIITFCGVTTTVYNSQTVNGRLSSAGIIRTNNKGRNSNF